MDLLNNLYKNKENIKAKSEPWDQSSMESDTDDQILFLLLSFLLFSRERAARGMNASIKVLQYWAYFLHSFADFMRPF